MKSSDSSPARAARPLNYAVSRHLLSQAELSKREAMMRSGGDGTTPTDQWTEVEQNRERACL